ncbi:DnaD domain protein [Bacillus sp. FJAT-47783]|uniref:DnaD domain-containing protein n=1 Tax=Bacillus sp. FJAT-47783 TaxID=2922712 RepID=UPI001FABBCF4|nr:DnaD domain protein [Bacillus sp. FJAT-47783]
MSKLLIHEHLILILPTLVQKVGLYEAIFLQQLHYWLTKSEHVHEGRRWVYNSMESWHEQLPFISVSTIRRMVKKLEEEKIIVTGNFNRSKLDRTKWYTIHYEALNPLLDDDQSSNQREHMNRSVRPHDLSNVNAPLPETTSETTTDKKEEEDNARIINPYTFSNKYEALNPLGDDQSSNQREHMNRSERPHDLSNVNAPLPETTSETTSDKKEEDNARIINPYTFFEQNGFGTIGGYIAEKIKYWCEDLSDELVVEAMKLAVEYGAKNWSYVESILRYWYDKGYETVADVHRARKAFKERMAQKERHNKPNSPTPPSDTEYDMNAGEDDDV